MEIGGGVREIHFLVDWCWCSGTTFLCWQQISMTTIQFWQMSTAKPNPSYSKLIEDFQYPQSELNSNGKSLKLQFQHWTIKRTLRLPEFELLSRTRIIWHQFSSQLESVRDNVSFNQINYSYSWFNHFNSVIQMIWSWNPLDN